jgi:hypothetical protein
MIALVLGTVAMGLVYRVLIAQQRRATDLAMRAAVDNTLRTAVGFISEELSHAGAGIAPSDFLAVASESLGYRARRGSGIACSVTSSSVDLMAEPLAAYRQPQPGRDSLMLFVGNDSVGNGWIVGPVNGVTASVCGGRRSLRISTRLDSLTVSRLAPGSLSPLLVVEVMQLKLYRSQGNYWLGARSVSGGETIQPVTGPLEAGGLAFSFTDSTDAPTWNPDAIRAGRVVVRAKADSAAALLPLRN